MMLPLLTLLLQILFLAQVTSDGRYLVVLGERRSAIMPQIIVAVFYRPTFLKDRTYCTSRKYILFKKEHKAIMAGENVPMNELDLIPDFLSSAYAK
jgi:hypothetical protein